MTDLELMRVRAAWMILGASMANGKVWNQICDELTEGAFPNGPTRQLFGAMLVGPAAASESLAKLVAPTGGHWKFVDALIAHLKAHSDMEKLKQDTLSQLHLAAEKLGPEEWFDFLRRKADLAGKGPTAGTENG